MRTALLVSALLAAAARGAAPECSVLFCGDGEACAERFARTWIAAAQDEAVRMYHTINGGYLERECTGGPRDERVAPFHVPLEHLVCIDTRELPREECAHKRCDFESHPELFEDDECVDAKHGRRGRGGRHKHAHAYGDQDQAACRRIESWLAIADKKLLCALDAADAGDQERAASCACVADLLFGRVAEHLLDTFAADASELRFLNGAARATQRYTHVNSAARLGVFADAQNLVARTRAVQSLRTCTDAAEPRLASALFYTSVNATDQTIDDVTQLVWAAGGTLASFDVSVAPVAPDNLCAVERAETQLELFDDTRRFPALDSQDWAVVLNDGAPRPYINLRASAHCPLIVLLERLPAGGDDADATQCSVAQLQLRRGADERAPDEFAALIEAAVFARVATGDECADAEPMFMDADAAGNETEAAFRAPRPGVPLTLAPGDSVCVGGERAGAPCTLESECGAGEACRRKPFAPRGAAYCYDGAYWDERRPCAFADADEECPYGECYGAVNGNAGGAYPLLHYYQSNECGSPASSADPVCADAHVARWAAHPNEASLA